MGRVSAAVHGALVALVYAVLEYALIVLAPMHRWGPSSLAPAHWLWESLLLSVYLVSGAAIGFAAALVHRNAPAQAATRWVLAAGLLLLAAGRFHSEILTIPNLLFDLACVTMAVAVLAVPRRSTWLSWLCSPWVVIPVALCLIEIKSRIGHSVRFSMAVLVMWAITALAVFAASRVALLRGALERRFLPFTAAGSAALFTACLLLTFWLDKPLPAIPAVKSSSAVRGPNVLLVILDTVRADHLSLYGYARRTTPNLEALARDSVVFQNAISAADITLSSHASIFTGLYASWHGARLHGDSDAGHLAPENLTLAEVLSQRGYTTMAVLANCAYLRADFGMDQGFALYDVRASVRGSSAYGEYHLRDLVRAVLNRFVSTAEMDRRYRRADQVTRDALDIVGVMQERTAPFFLTLNYMDAHDPYIPPPPYRDLFPGRNPRFDNHRVFRLQQDFAQMHRPRDADADLRHIFSQYDGAIAFMDAQIKLLIDGLKRAKLYDDTLIIITSDHGEALGERNALGHPASVHQELVRVPLLIKFAGAGGARPAGTEVDMPVSGVDLLPTVLDAGGIPAPILVNGRSLLRLAAGDSRPVIAESFPDYLTRLRRRTDHGQRAVYQGNWKFISAAGGPRELFDLAKDPGELHSLYRPDDPVSRKLSALLEAWIRGIPRKSAAAQPVDQRAVENLRSLGYVQ